MFNIWSNPTAHVALRLLWKLWLWHWIPDKMYLNYDSLCLFQVLKETAGVCLRQNPQFLKVSLTMWCHNSCRHVINSNVILTDTNSWYWQIHIADTDTYSCYSQIHKLILTNTHSWYSQIHKLILTGTYSCYSQIHTADTYRYTQLILTDRHSWYWQIHTADTHI